MAGFDRLIDPLTGDYVSDGKGSTKKTRTAATAVYHQLKGQRNAWWGDAEAGSDLHTFRRSNASEEELGRVKAVTDAALRPLVDLQRIDQVTVTVDREGRHRALLTSSMHDVQTGEEIDLSPLLPFNR